MPVLPWEGCPLASLLLCDLNVMEGLLTMALGNKMLIPPKQTLGFIGMGYHQNALLQNTSYRFMARNVLLSIYLDRVVIGRGNPRLHWRNADKEEQKKHVLTPPTTMCKRKPVRRPFPTIPKRIKADFWQLNRLKVSSQVNYLGKKQYCTYAYLLLDSPTKMYLHVSQCTPLAT